MNEAAEKKEVGEIKDITDYMVKDLEYQRELVKTLVDRLAPILPTERGAQDGAEKMIEPAKLTPLGRDLSKCHKLVIKANTELREALSLLEI